MNNECDCCTTSLTDLGLVDYKKACFKEIFMDKKENDSLELRVLKRMIKSKASYTYEDIINLIAEESFSDCADELVHVDKFSYVEGFKTGYSYKANSLKRIEEAESE